MTKKKKEIPVRCSITSQMLVKAQVPPPHFVDAQNQNTMKNSKCDTLFTLLFPCAVISFAVNHVIHPIFRLFFVCLLVVCFYSGKCYSKLQCSYHKNDGLNEVIKTFLVPSFFHTSFLPQALNLRVLSY